MFNFKFKSSITDFLLKQTYKYIKQIYFNIRLYKKSPRFLALCGVDAYISFSLTLWCKMYICLKDDILA